MDKMRSRPGAGAAGSGAGAGAGRGGALAGEGGKKDVIFFDGDGSGLRRLAGERLAGEGRAPGVRLAGRGAEQFFDELLDTSSASVEIWKGAAICQRLLD